MGKIRQTLPQWPEAVSPNSLGSHTPLDFNSRLLHLLNDLTQTILLFFVFAMVPPSQVGISILQSDGWE